MVVGLADVDDTSLYPISMNILDGSSLLWYTTCTPIRSIRNTTMFDSTLPKDTSFLYGLYNHPHIQEKMKQALLFIKENPEGCLVFGTERRFPAHIQIRIDGGRVRVPMRIMMWMATHDGNWEPLVDTGNPFEASTCGTKGCCNPNHVRLREVYKITVNPRTQRTVHRV
jgi:hypothetical protein